MHEGCEQEEDGEDGCCGEGGIVVVVFEGRFVVSHCWQLDILMPWSTGLLDMEL